MAGSASAPSPRWQQLLDERVDEAVAALSSVPGVRGLVLGGSVGRGEPWPISDIDILPISTAGAETAAEIERLDAVRATICEWNHGDNNWKLTANTRPGTSFGGATL